MTVLQTNISALKSSLFKCCVELERLNELLHKVTAYIRRYITELRCEALIAWSDLFAQRTHNHVNNALECCSGENSEFVTKA